jgi:hypothetical protein
VEAAASHAQTKVELVFRAVPGKKAGLQRVKITTDQANAEIAAADNVWVPAAE